MPSGLMRGDPCLAYTMVLVSNGIRILLWVLLSLSSFCYVSCYIWFLLCSCFSLFIFWCRRYEDVYLRTRRFAAGLRTLNILAVCSCTSIIFIIFIFKTRVVLLQFAVLTVWSTSSVTLSLSLPLPLFFLLLILLLILVFSWLRKHFVWSNCSSYSCAIR